MFGLFKSPPFHDPKLGELVRSRGLWRGLLTVEAGVSAPLALSGTRTEPHAQALAAARQVAQAFASWRPAIEQALFEHYEPYAEAVTAGELPSSSEALPRIAAPGDVWSHVSLVFVSVTPLSGLLTTELGYTTAWDDDTRLEFGFSQESSSSSVAVFCPREDDARPFHRADPHRRTAGAVPTRNIFKMVYVPGS